MISRLRRTFVAVLMAVAAVFVLGILGSLYASTAAAANRACDLALRSALGFGPPMEAPAPWATLQVDKDGAVTVVEDRLFRLTTKELEDAVAAAEKTGASKGALRSLDLRYESRPFGPGAVRYAFVDVQGQEAALRRQAVASAAIGVGALCAFWCVAVLLARWMVRPVERAWKSQRQFVADAAHELRTPLATAIANVSLMREQPGDAKRTGRRLETTACELGRLQSLTEGLLALARADAAEASGARPTVAPVDLSQLTALAAASFEPVFFETGRTLSTQVTPGLWVLGDEKRLRELVDVTVDNACRYSLPESTAELMLDAADGSARLRVCNPAEPLSPDQLSRVFERFYRADPSRGTVSGHGLGLSIAQKTVEELGGSIAASYEDGAFVLKASLPLTKAPTV